MSLLGQALALGQGALREEDVRAFLGLAGQDVFFSLMQGIHDRDLVAVEQVLRGVLDQGLDLGFFLRELATCWRNMFLLRLAGESAMQLLNVSENDARSWLDWAERFHPGQIHASWQMTLEGQRRVMSSMEPAMALELLLLNLASLPDLLDLESLGGSRPASPPSRPGTGGAAPAGPGGGRGMPGASRPAPGRSAAPAAAAPQYAPPRSAANAPNAAQGAPAQASYPNGREHRPQAAPQPASGVAESGPGWQSPPGGQEPPPPGDDPDPGQGDAFGAGPEPGISPYEADASEANFSAPGPQDWQSFLAFLRDQNGESEFSYANLRGVRGDYRDGLLTLVCPNDFMSGRLRGGSSGLAFLKTAREYFGPDVELRVRVEEGLGALTNQRRMQEIEKHPAVQRVKSAFDASIKDVTPRDRA
jgi:DNA polymerase-3 subunit gamma/tau